MHREACTAVMNSVSEIEVAGDERVVPEWMVEH